MQPKSDKDEKSPILNNPYEEPRLHYDTDADGNLDYSRIVQGRRPYTSNIDIMPNRQGQQSLFAGSDFENNDPNAVFINDGVPQSERLEKLNKIAIQQMRVLENIEDKKLLTE